METVLFVAGFDSNKIACAEAELQSPSVETKMPANRNRFIWFMAVLVAPKGERCPGLVFSRQAGRKAPRSCLMTNAGAWILPFFEARTTRSSPFLTPARPTLNVEADNVQQNVAKSHDNQRRKALGLEGLGEE